MDRTAGKELALVRGPGVPDPTFLATLRSKNPRSRLPDPISPQIGPFVPAHEFQPWASRPLPHCSGWYLLRIGGVSELIYGRGQRQIP